MSSDNAYLIEQFASPGTPASAIESTLEDLESTPEGRAWLEATANLSRLYKHSITIPADTTVADTDTSNNTNDQDSEPLESAESTDSSALVGANMEIHTLDVGDNFSSYSNNNSASGNFYSIPIPFLSKVGIEINSDNAKRKFEIKDKHFWAAAVGAQVGTLYYDDINDLSGESACRVSTVGPWFGVWFSRYVDGGAQGVGQKKFYAAFQAANVGLATPDVFWLKGGKWSTTG